jgi:hypothetical protein
MELPFPHGKYLAVYRPKEDAPFFISEPDGKDTYEPMTEENTGPLIPTATFLTMKVVQLRISDAIALRQRAGYTEPEKLFVPAGSYQFEVGSGFETDGVVIDAICSVTFRP